MPSKNEWLIQLRGDAKYAQYLDLLLAMARKRRGVVGYAVDTRNELAELALARLGEEFGLEAPPRARAPGTNQYS